MIWTDLYPEAKAYVSGEDDELIASIVEQALSDHAEWVSSHTVRRELAGRAFRLVVDTPKDWDDSVLWVPAEYANGISIPAVARARVIRAMVNPSAKLIYQPNTTCLEDNVNLSNSERTRIRHGDASPLIDRARIEIGEAGEVMTFGPSQGAAIVGPYASHPDTALHSMVVFESPTVVDRSHYELIKAFMTDGKQLAANISLNRQDDAASPLVAAHLESLTARGMMLYGIGAARLDNLAIVGLMRRMRLEYDIRHALDKGAGVAHVWARTGTVSPDEANLNIRTSIEHDRNLTTRYVPIRLTGKYADHSATNVYGLAGATMRAAKEKAT